MKTPKEPEYQMTGFDAYEAAWDTVSKHLWSALGFNAIWFGGFLLVLFSLFLLCVIILESWAVFIVSGVLFFMVALPLWEGANILRYGSQEGLPDRGRALPVAAIIVARVLFLLLVLPGYLIFVLPGIYIHSRLALYLPALLRSTKANPLESLSISWRLSRSRFVKLYTLWIAVVVSHPASLLPFGLGLIVRQPVNGLAKDLMFLSSSNRPRDGPETENQPTDNSSETNKEQFR